MEENVFAKSFGSFEPLGQEILIHEAEEPMWDVLISIIITGDVIPVIDSEVLTNETNIHKQLLDFIAKVFNVQSTPQSFSELVYDTTFLKVNEKWRKRQYIYMDK